MGEKVLLLMLNAGRSPIRNGTRNTRGGETGRVSWKTTLSLSLPLLPQSLGPLGDKARFLNQQTESNN